MSNVIIKAFEKPSIETYHVNAPQQTFKVDVEVGNTYAVVDGIYDEAGCNIYDDDSWQKDSFLRGQVESMLAEKREAINNKNKARLEMLKAKQRQAAAKEVMRHLVLAIDKADRSGLTDIVVELDRTIDWWPEAWRNLRLEVEAEEGVR